MSELVSEAEDILSEPPLILTDDEDDNAMDLGSPMTGMDLDSAHPALTLETSRASVGTSRDSDGSGSHENLSEGGSKLPASPTLTKGFESSIHSGGTRQSHLSPELEESLSRRAPPMVLITPPGGGPAYLLPVSSLPPAQQEEISRTAAAMEAGMPIAAPNWAITAPYHGASTAKFVSASDQLAVRVASTSHQRREMRRQMQSLLPHGMKEADPSSLMATQLLRSNRETLNAGGGHVMGGAGGEHVVHVPVFRTKKQVLVKHQSKGKLGALNNIGLCDAEGGPLGFLNAAGCLDREKIYRVNLDKKKKKQGGRLGCC